jgi:sec-independent protein translocase protein TatA
MTSVFGIFGLGPPEIAVIAVIGIILFGRKLPEVGRYLGKGIIEFKKGMKGLEDEPTDGYSASNPQSSALPEAPRPPQRITSSAPRFDEPGAASAPPKI